MKRMSAEAKTNSTGLEFPVLYNENSNISQLYQDLLILDELH